MKLKKRFTVPFHVYGVLISIILKHSPQLVFLQEFFNFGADVFQNIRMALSIYSRIFSLKQSCQ